MGKWGQTWGGVRPYSRSPVIYELLELEGTPMGSGFNANRSRWWVWGGVTHGAQRIPTTSLCHKYTDMSSDYFIAPTDYTKAI